MANDPPFLDLSAYVTAADVARDDDAAFNEVPLGPLRARTFTLTGHFDPDPRPICPLCAMRFTVHELTALASIGDEPIGLICDACAITVLRD